MTRSTPTLRARPDGAAPERVGDRLVLSAERQWLLEAGPRTVDAVAGALPGMCERLSDGLLLLDFGRAVGLLELPGLGRVEVVAGPWDRRHYEGMLAELSEVAAGLPFSGDAAAALPYDRSVAARRDVLYHAFVYLRYALSDAPPPDQRLTAALRVVLNDPHRRWTSHTRRVPLDRVRRVGPGALADAATGRGGLVAAPAPPPAATALARRLHGHLPERVAERQVRDTVDTPENRFVRAFLDQARGVVEGMRRAVARAGAGCFASRVLDDCARMERALEPAARHPLWREVGPMVHLPIASTVLQRRRGYREVLEHFTRLRMATRIPLRTDEVRALLESRDIGLLYELWCYFTLVSRLQSILGAPRSAARRDAGAAATVGRHEFTVEWDGGVRLVYAPRFAPGARPGRASYSVGLRPDMALETPHGLHLFDARFRPPRLEAGDAQELTTLHAYRDAIPGAQSVWILHPGTEFRFFGPYDAAPAHAPTALASRPRGIGIAPLRPEADGGEIVEVLARLAAPPPRPSVHRKGAESAEGAQRRSG